MSLRSLLALGALICACSRPAEVPPPPSSPEGAVKNAAAPSPTSPDSPATAALPATSGKAPDAGGPQIDEGKRRAAVAAELGKVNPHPIVSFAGSLAPQEKNFVKALVNAAKVVEQLNALQIHRDNLTFADKVKELGTPDDVALYARNQHPWCEDSDAPECTTLVSAGPRSIGAYLWPEGMTDDEFKALQDAPNAKALLSPFTVVRRDGQGGWTATPFAKDPLLGPYMGKLGLHLREAARETPDVKLAKFLNARADAFVSDDPFPYDASDYDWIALDGPWDVTVGPYETYKDPRDLKARFEMYFGRANVGVESDLAPFRKHLQQMEEKVADLVGRDLYQPRKLDPRIAVRAIDVWMASGDGRNPQGAIAAYHLPNRGASVDEGLYKKVMLVNHMRAFEPILEARAEEVLVPEQRAYVTGEADILDTTFHEFSHGFGSHDELVIARKDGTTTTVHAALQEYAGLLEETKADTLGLWLVQQQRQAGSITDEQAYARYATQILHAFGLLQYAFDGTYPKMSAIEIGWYLEHGALTRDAGNGLWSLNFDAFPAAVEALAKEVASIQLSGDHERAARLVGRYVTIADGHAEPSALLKPLLADVKARFDRKSIKSISITYEVRDL